MSRARSIAVRGGRVIAVLLPVIVLTLWMASYWRALEYRAWPAEGGIWSFVLLHGSVQAGHDQQTSATDQDASGWLVLRASGFRRNWQVLAGWGTTGGGTFMGFRYAYGVRGPAGGRDFWTVRVPLWSVALLAGGLAVAANWKPVRAYRRRRVGRCAMCGYDLRATPGRCPECGEQVNA